MKYLITLFLQFLLFCACAQNNFTPSQIDEVLLKLPESLSQGKTDYGVIRAIEAVDKNYRQIADTLYNYRSLPHTIFQNILIETNDSVFINPVSFGGRLQLTNILFYNSALNARVDSLAKTLQKTQRTSLYDYLKANYDNFSIKT